jgi:O-antigen/teichoic acid export membrane protein
MPVQIRNIVQLKGGDTEVRGLRKIQKDVLLLLASGRRFTGPSLLAAVGFLVPAMANLVANVVLARGLAPASYGIYVLAISLTGSVSLGELGISAALIRYIAADLSEDNWKSVAQLFTTALSLVGMLGTIAFGACYVLAPELGRIYATGSASGDETVAFRIAGANVALFWMTMVCVAYFKGRGRFDRSSALLILIAVLQQGATVIACLYSRGRLNVTLAASLAAVSMACACAVVVCYRDIASRSIGPSAFRIRRRQASRLLKFGSITAANSVAVVLLVQVQRYVIGASLGPAAAGVYHLAYLPVVAVTGLLNALSEVLYPWASALKHRMAVANICATATGINIVIYLPIAIAIAILAPRLVTGVVNGPNARILLSTLRVLLIAYAFLATTPPLFHILNGLGMPWLNSVFTWGNATLNILIIVLYAKPKGDVVGYAVALLSSCAVSTIVYWAWTWLVLFRKKNNEV